MIVFDLKCAANGHMFEAWFGSSADYDSQSARGLVTCPMCGGRDVGKALMAPAVGAKGNRNVAAPGKAMVASNAPDASRMRAMIEGLAKVQAEALKDSRWVGRQFADQARAMHYGEQDHVSIHGEVAPDEARALIEEGVEVAALPFPVVPPEAQN